MNDSASLGDTIRDRRLALGYSLGQLATKVNKTASSIRAWERGDTVPSEEEAADVAVALDLDTALLVALREPAKVWDSEEVEEIDVHDPWNEDDESPQTESDQPTATAAASVAAADAASEETVADTATAEAKPADPAAEVAAEESQPESDEPETEDPQSEQVAEPEPVAAVASDEADVAATQATSDPDQFAELFEAKTEAVPVVPATSVAVAQPQADPVLASASAQPVETRSDNPVVAAWDDLRALYYRIFDPRRRWIYRVRFILLLIAFFIMLRVLAWAAGNLFEALGEVLDSVSFSPGETPDVEN